jgi:hypothetical protein
MGQAMILVVKRSWPKLVIQMGIFMAGADDGKV